MDIVVNQEVKSRYALRQSFNGFVFVDACEHTEPEQCKKDFELLLKFCNDKNIENGFKQAPARA
jgi:hypothetical protein